MLRDLSRFPKEEYDLLIIGGGINGAAIANIAVSQGLKVALLEKGDFAGGTSSKSTKLIHGGIRYLENLEFDLVRESLKERSIQLRSIPHLVKPIGFIIPVYKSDHRPLWKMKLGVFLYDFLGGPYRIEKYRQLRADEVMNLGTGIKSEGLEGAVMYFDAQMDDARVVLENVLSADEKGAHIANYAEATSFILENGKAAGVNARDVLNDAVFAVKAKKIICAGGPWTNELLKMENSQAPEKVRTTKGIHVLYKGEISKYAFLIPSQSDQRVFFIIPWMGNSLIGTTDTDYSGRPDDVNVEKEDIDYLFQEARRVFPLLDFSQENIITTFAGLRPLVIDDSSFINKLFKRRIVDIRTSLNVIGKKKVSKMSRSPFKVSRKHVIEESASGIIYVMGGKYTTYRQIAIESVKKVIKEVAVPENEYPLFGSGPIEEKPADVAREYRLEEDIVISLMNKYGTRYKDVLRLAKNAPELRSKICDCSSTIAAQVVYSIQVEMAQNADDIIWRRLSLSYLACPSHRCRQKIAQYVLQLCSKD